MNVIQFILHLGIINIVFSYVWKWVFVLPSALLFFLIKIDNASYIVKAFGSYLLSSLTAILTLIAIQDNPTILSALLFSFISIFVLYMGYASNYYEAQQQFVGEWPEYRYELYRKFQYEGFYMIGAIGLYIIALFEPIIAVNFLTIWLFNVIGWVYNLKFIGWLIGIGSVLFLLGIIWHGIIISGIFIGSIFRKIKDVNKEIH